MPTTSSGDAQWVGRAIPRRDLYEKVTGSAIYTVDVTPSGTLHAKVVRSSHAHARIVGVDKTAALAVEGVVAVITSEDLVGLFPRFGHIVPDHCILAIDKVRYYGEPVALVVAETTFAAAEGAAAVDVRYDELPAVMTAEAAMRPGAPLVHEVDYQSTGDASFAAMAAAPGRSAEPAAILREVADSPAARSNVSHEVDLSWGNVDAAFAEADLVVETTVQYPMLYAYAMEPYNAVASYADGHLDVTSCAQHPFMVRNDLARIFQLPLARVSVKSPYLGGGYGSKSYTKVEPLASVGSWYTGRPVKVVLDVEEAIYTTRVDAAVAHVRSGFDSSGRILAREFDVVLDSGAYADNSPLVIAKVINRCFGPYRVPNLRVRGRSVYTNTSPASSYRGFGAPQGVLAGEVNLEQAAQKLGIDPVEVRRRNLVDVGEEILRGKRGIDADLKADLEMAIGELTAYAQPGPWRGMAVCCSASDAGAYPVSTASVRVQTDGSVVVSSGSTEMGQGSRSVLAQIAAEELGVDLGMVHVVQSDTGSGPYERTTGASRTTTLVGLAVQRACADARAKLREMAAEVLEASADMLVDIPGGILGPDGTATGFGQIIVRWFGADAGEVTGVGLVRREGDTAKMPPFWEVGMVGVEVEVDDETGVVDVQHLVTVGDVGFAINPRAVEGQDLGAATQGLGGALYEELVYDGPQIINPNIVEYHVPRMADMPARISTLLAERRDGVGPYGAKGAGEGSLNPVGAAVLSAVAKATGSWPSRLPVTPERVWRLVNGLPEADAE
jgi:CO/xanthine dehydrogenase Mo-binding subunit